MELAPVVLEDPWLIYHVQADDVLSRVAVDLSVRPPVAGQPHLTRLSMPHQGPAGFSFSPEDGTALDALAEGLTQTSPGFLGRLLADEPKSMTFVGRVTRDGVCHLYVYSDRPFPKRRLVALERLVHRREFSVAEMPDPEWCFYRDEIHPGPATKALLMSQALVELRRKGGDRPEREREIDHTLFFPTAEGRAAFLSECGKGGRARLFELEDARAERRFGIELTRIHRADLISTDIQIVALSSHAVVHGGQYDGWGAPENRA